MGKRDDNQDPLGQGVLGVFSIVDGDVTVQMRAHIDRLSKGTLRSTFPFRNASVQGKKGEWVQTKFPWDKECWECFSFE